MTVKGYAQVYKVIPFCLRTAHILLDSTGAPAGMNMHRMTTPTGWFLQNTLHKYHFPIKL